MVQKVVMFGEILLRFSPPDHRRISQCTSMDVEIGGGEANVAISLSNYDVPVEYVTRLPDNPLGDLCMQHLRRFGIGISHVLRGGERQGIYFLEAGASQRSSKVTYDRSYSSISTVQPGMLDWQTIFQNASWFHITGITPALSYGAAEVCLVAVKTAQAMGLSVSCDLNYRKNLWKWGKPHGEVMSELLEHCNLVIANEEDANSYFGIKAVGSDMKKGLVDADKYRFVCESLKKKFPNLDVVAITLRGSFSASHNSWSGVLFAGGVFYKGPFFDIDHIIDRVGSGDAFVGGLLYGIQTYPGDWQKALNFAVSASCLKHSIVGDFNLVTVPEVESLMSGETSGRVSR